MRLCGKCHTAEANPHLSLCGHGSVYWSCFMAGTKAEPSEATFEAIQTRNETLGIRRDLMSTAGRYRPVKHPHQGGCTIERIPDRIEVKRHEAYMAVLTPIYDRSARACKVKGQKHLREFEA